jgi:hypothetical protein
MVGVEGDDFAASGFNENIGSVSMAIVWPVMVGRPDAE